MTEWENQTSLDDIPACATKHNNLRQKGFQNCPACGRKIQNSQTQLGDFQ